VGESPSVFHFHYSDGFLAMVTVALSIKPTLNLFSKHQAMNERYNALHLIGSYA
jgi:hypothetical protein